MSVIGEERELFIKSVFEKTFEQFEHGNFHSSSLNSEFIGWQRRSEIEEKKLEVLAKKHGSTIGKLHFTEKELAETRKEISKLKEKLSKYEH